MDHGNGVAWTHDEQAAVEATLERFPVASGRCFDVARDVLEVARSRDATSKAWKIKPRQGRFVVPKIHLGQRWFHHFTVEVEHHGVDALTGSAGTPWQSYLGVHWKYADDLLCIESSLQDEAQ